MYCRLKSGVLTNDVDTRLESISMVQMNSTRTAILMDIQDSQSLLIQDVLQTEMYHNIKHCITK